MIIPGIIILLTIYFGKSFLKYALDYNQTHELKRIGKLRKRINTKEEELPVSKLESINDENLLGIIYTIESCFNKKDLNNFHRNIKNLKLINLNVTENECTLYSPEEVYLAGAYLPFSNKMITYNGKATSHEMLHVSSTNNSKRFAHLSVGFQQVNRIKPHIGEGLNEGYTTHLNRRLFECVNGPVVIQSIYIMEPIVAKAIEDVIGSEKMQSLYLNADLKGLYDSLSTYLTEKETDELVIGLDNINKYTSKTNPKNEDFDVLIKSSSKIALLINKILIQKMQENNYDQKSIYNYFTNMNNFKEGLFYLGEDKYDDIINFIDEQEDIIFEFVNGKSINTTKEKVKKLKNYHVERE